VSDDGIILCRIGCCPGCQDCYGMSLGCHQDPCRCGLPCSCDLATEESLRADGTCERHDPREDARTYGTGEPEWAESWDWSPCPICGEEGPCGYDAEDRPLIHPIPAEDDL
jgi:hypothetical protein